MADKLAKERSRQHDATRTAEQDAGGKQANMNADYYGVLAELVVTMFVETAAMAQGKPCQNAILDGWRDRPDILLNKRKIEIKGLPPGKTFACVNAEQHAKADPATFYLFAKFATDGKSVTLFGPVTHKTVGTWSERHDRHSAYRSPNISRL